MENTHHSENKNNHNRSLWIPVVIAFVAAQFLFFVDEGYYDFRWMSKWGNWIVFFIYFAFLLGGQLLIRFTFFRRSKQYTLISSIIGLIVGTGIALLVFSGAWR